MSAYEEYQKTSRIAVREVSSENPMAEQSRGFFSYADEISKINQRLWNKAKKKAVKEGELAGSNSVVLTPEGTIRRSDVPDAGELYTQAFLEAQRASALSSIQLGLKGKFEEFQVLNKDNPDALDALSVFEEEYVVPLIDNTQKDIQGQVGVIASSFLMGTTNYFTEQHELRERREQIQNITEAISTNIANLEEAYSNGLEQTPGPVENIPLPDTLEILTDSLIKQSVSSGLLSPEEGAKYTEGIRSAILSGQLMHQVKGKTAFEALNVIDEFMEKDIDGLNAETKAQITANAVRSIEMSAKIKAEAKRIEKENETDKIIDFSMWLGEKERNAQKNNSVISKSEIDAKVIELGLDNPSTMTGVRAINAAYNLQEQQEKDALAERQNKNFAQTISDIDLNRYNPVEIRENIANNFYSTDQARQIINKLNKIEKKIIEKFAKDEGNPEEMSRLARIFVADGATPEKFENWAKEDNPFGRWLRKNPQVINRLIKANDTEFGYSKRKADGGVPDDHFARFLHRETGKAKFDIRDRTHVDAFVQYAQKNIRTDLTANIPKLVSRFLTNWKTVLHDREATANLAGLARSLSDMGIAVPGMTTQQLMQVESALRGRPEDFAKNSEKLISVIDPERDELTAIATRFTVSPNFSVEMEEKLRNLTKDSSALELFGRNLFGQTMFGFMINQDLNPASADLVTAQGRPFFRDISGSKIEIDTIPVLRAAYMKHFAGDAIGDHEKAMEMAFRDVGHSGGFTKFAEPQRNADGEILEEQQFSYRTLERFLAQNQFKGRPIKYLQGAFVNLIKSGEMEEELKKQDLQGLDFGGQGFARLTSNELWFQTDIGRTFIEMVEDEDRFEQALGEGRIYLKPHHKQGFRIFLRLGNQTEHFQLSKIWIPNQQERSFVSESFINSKVSDLSEFLNYNPTNKGK
tara:strand:- start:718 stop:3486 length:2769 start_codon:yes stop_codon:yes gene_type:complete